MSGRKASPKGSFQQWITRYGHPQDHASSAVAREQQGEVSVQQQGYAEQQEQENSAAAPSRLPATSSTNAVLGIIHPKATSAPRETTASLDC
mmetsp:Transcript_17875/g.52204  ORF Transcript_17875/g.52204 Transcript_17875/m.52204 type:complete len:92 (-) Transcript_17875:53-328(-)